MLLYVLECAIAFVILLVGVTEVIVPLLQGKPLFPMLTRRDDSLHSRLDEIEQELMRSQRMDEIEKEVGGLFNSHADTSPDIRPGERKKEIN